MSEQVIISVGREFGSGGHVIAEKLAKKFELPLYDDNLLESVAEERELNHQGMKKYDERPKSKLFTRTVRGHSNSLSENVADMQFAFLKKMAAEGKSFVVVGRCSETILKEYKALVSIFILGDYGAKVERIKEKYQVNEEEAKILIRKEDWNRKTYHNYYCKGKWGDSRNYDISVNSSKLGIDKTTDMLYSYIKERMTQEV